MSFYGIQQSICGAGGRGNAMGEGLKVITSVMRINLSYIYALNFVKSNHFASNATKPDSNGHTLAMRMHGVGVPPKHTASCTNSTRLASSCVSPESSIFTPTAIPCLYKASAVNL